MIFSFLKNIRKIKTNGERKKIGLALGGGAAWGLGHVGVIKAIEDTGISISVISGTSIGALIGAFYANAISSSEMEKLTDSISWLSLAKPTVPNLGLFSNEPMGDFIKKHIDVENIEDLKVPFSCVALDLLKGTDHVFHSGHLSNAIRASCAVPGIFKPVSINHGLFVDGGVINNVPVSVAKEMGAEYIIAVNLLSEFNHWTPQSTPEVILKTSLLSQYSASKHDMEIADLLINLDTRQHSPIDIKGCHDLIQYGYKTAKKELKLAGF